jgi:signal transduction histidine kinase
MNRRERHTIRQWTGTEMDSHWRTDMAIAFIVATIGIVGTYIGGQNQPDRREVDAIAVILLATGSAALLFRHQYPGVVLIFIKALTLLYLIFDYPKGPNFLPIIIAFFTAVMYGRRLIAWTVLAGEFILFPWLPYFVGNTPAPTFLEIFGIAGWLLVLATVAEIAHIRRQRILRSREEEAHRRASEERLRIARELHDVLGHHISLISVQAGVSLHLMDKQPEQARIALTVIKDASKEALRELRSVLDVLRYDNEAAPRAPSPTLTNLSDLVTRAREAGLQVHTEVSGDLRGLPVSVDLAGFRIVQEALTNVLRHSRQGTSSVYITRNEHEITLQIDNKSGGEVFRVGPTSGQGILGMKERAGALGGVVEAGSSSDGGFRVFARLPLDGNALSKTGAGT